MHETAWPRRNFMLAGAASALAACTSLRDGGQITINLAGREPPPQKEEAPTLLEAAFDQGSRMMVPVEIERNGPFQFVVDTGANRSVVSNEVAAHLRLESHGRIPVHGIAGVEPATLFKVGRMRVGEVISYGLDLPGLPGAKLGADGILGVDVLRDRKVAFDFQDNRFSIAPTAQGVAIGRRGTDTRLHETDIVTVPAHFRFGQLVIVGAFLDQAPISAFIDSGSQISVGNLALRDLFLKLDPTLATRFTDVPLISATGQVSQGQLAMVSSLRLGGLRLTRMLVAFADLHIFQLWELQAQPAILIGIDVLQQFESVSLDFGRREVIFQASNRGLPIERHPKRFDADHRRR